MKFLVHREVASIVDRLARRIVPGAKVLVRTLLSLTINQLDEKNGDYTDSLFQENPELTAFMRAQVSSELRRDLTTRVP